MNQTSFETSETTAKLDAALAKAQGEIEAASKDKVNPAFRSKYADLTAVWAAIRPALSKHGIAVTQWPVHSEDGRLHMVTRLAHDGEWMRGHFSIPVQKPDAHGHGSAITYAKRFTLAAAIGVVADEDDDGNHASGKGNGNGSAFGAATGTQGASKAAAKADYALLVNQIRGAVSLKALEEWSAANMKAVNALPGDWVEELRLEYMDRKAELTKSLAA